MSESRRARRPQGTKPDQKRRVRIQWRLHPAERRARKIQNRGDARVQCKKEASKIRRAIAANRSANDNEKQPAIPEFEASMKTFVLRVDTAREQRDRQFSQEKPILTNSRPRCCKLPSLWCEGTYREPTITKWCNAEKWCWGMPETNHGVVNIAKI